MKKALPILLGLFLWLCPAGLFAGEADVVAVTVEKTAEMTYTFHVTVSHGDSGWQHYANKWDVVTVGGKVLGTRKLHHPHEDEQPFRRSLSGVEISGEMDAVMVRAHDSVHGYGGKTVRVTLPRPSD
jgi:hypothetical protein